MSVRRRLVLLLLASFGGVWAVVAVQVYRNSAKEMGELFDAQLAQTARFLAALTDAGPVNSAAVARHLHEYLPALDYEHRLGYQLWQGGTLVLASLNAPKGPMGFGGGFSDRLVGGIRWRCFGLVTDTPGEVLYVGETYELRATQVREAAAESLIPSLWSFPVLGLIVWVSVGRGLRPVRRVAREIALRRPGQMEAVQEHSVPAEIRPLTRALNRLLQRLQEALDKERRFTADAAHELRTPLTVIRTHAQIAARSEDPAERTEALQQVIEGVDRSARLVSQMLHLARLEPDHPTLDPRPCSLLEIAARVLENLRPQAEAGDRHLALDPRGSGPWLLRGLPAGLEILLRNLVDNALKYTPRGSCVVLRLRRRDDGRLYLLVADDGPGIPRNQRRRVLERFYRQPGTRTTGSGLGLAIVEQVCRLHSARVALGRGPRGQGLCVRVVFPARGASSHGAVG
jgi:signal transduction histidine kinase